MTDVGQSILSWSELNWSQKMHVKYLCESSFLAFHKAMFAIVQGEKWTVNWHHKYLAQNIEDLILGRMPGESLIINVPPGAGKTEIFSIHATVWAHIKTKKLRNLHVSFSKDLALRNSIRVKDIIRSQAFQEMWPCQFATDQAQEWTLVDPVEGFVKTEVFARSMGGQITGARGGFVMPGFSGGIVLDDPDKIEDMFSSIKRARSQRIISSTIRSRRAIKTSENPTHFIVIQQRVHVDDTTGFLLKGGIGKNIKFRHIVIPALIDQDYIDALPDGIREDCIKSICHTKQVNGYWSYWPTGVGVDDLMGEWESNEYTFLSQSMQRPIALGGNLIKSDSWAYYGDDTDEVLNEDGTTSTVRLCDLATPPTFEYRFITADTAQKTKEHNDFTVFCEWGYFKDTLYLIDMWRGKVEAPELRKQFKTFVDTAWARNGINKGNLRAVLVEDKSSGTGLIQELKGKLPLGITAVQRSTDKLTRAMDSIPMISAGRVALPRGKKFVHDFVSEHSEFSADDSHKHDDMCDNTFDAVDYALLKSKSKALDFMLNR